MSSFPHWIELSGLPARLREKTGGISAWVMLRTIIDLDCSLNSKPGTLDMTIIELADRAGLDADDARQALVRLQKMKLISTFIADDNEEQSLVKVADPFKAPTKHSAVKHMPTAGECRYCDCPDNQDYDSSDPVLQEVCDLYMNQIASTMNSFTVDKLRALRSAAPIEDIRRAFKHAEFNNVRNLGFITRRCLDYRKTKEQTNA